MHLGSMPEDSGSRYQGPAFNLNWGACVRKTRKFELPSSNTQIKGGVTPPPPKARYI